MEMSPSELLMYDLQCEVLGWPAHAKIVFVEISERFTSNHGMRSEILTDRKVILPEKVLA